MKNIGIIETKHYRLEINKEKNTATLFYKTEKVRGHVADHRRQKEYNYECINIIHTAISANNVIFDSMNNDEIVKALEFILNFSRFNLYIDELNEIKEELK